MHEPHHVHVQHAVRLLDHVSALVELTIMEHALKHTCAHTKVTRVLGTFAIQFSRTMVGISAIHFFTQNKIFTFSHRNAPLARTMDRYKSKLPFVVAFNKTDVVSHEFAVEWMTDFNALQVRATPHLAVPVHLLLDRASSSATTTFRSHDSESTLDSQLHSLTQ